MRYLSTRGGAPAASFQDILLEGLAPDGGLYVPEAWPQFSLNEIESFARMPYASLAAAVLARFAPDIPPENLRKMTQKAYSPAIFCHARPGSDTQKIFPLRPLDKGLSLLELSNGPTLAFKDAAMQLMSYLLCWALGQEKKTLTILGATSGDTGSAAMQALRGKPGLRVVMLSPASRMSVFQRAQMYAVYDENVMNVAVRGTFDDCQDLVKALNADAAFKAKHRLGAINSINWARIAAQTVYYFAAYLQAAEKTGQPVSFAVPSGNFGNAYAGYAAKRMGLPIERIVVATNENDALHRTFMTGAYAPRLKARATSSPSMDITKASNFERAVFDAAGRDGKQTAVICKAFQHTGKIDFANDHPAVWDKLRALGFVSSSGTHLDRLDLIREAYKRWGVLIDPHTADGLKGALSYHKPGERMVALETAQAVTFEKTIVEALGFKPKPPPGLEDLLFKSQNMTVIDPRAQTLKTLIDEWKLPS